MSAKDAPRPAPFERIWPETKELWKAGHVTTGGSLTREKVLEIASRLYGNGLSRDATVYTGSPHEWTLRDAVLDYAWTHPGTTREGMLAALAFGNLKLIQREFVE